MKITKNYLRNLIRESLEEETRQREIIYLVVDFEAGVIRHATKDLEKAQNEAEEEREAYSQHGVRTDIKILMLPLGTVGTSLKRLEPVEVPEFK